MLEYLLMGVFVLCGALFVYHHLLYPLLLKRLAAARRRAGTAANPRPAPLLDDELPTMTLLVPAYNEARVIARKVRNAAALDYPRDRLEIVFALDGCTDDTFAILQQTVAELPADAPKIRIVNHTLNRGKIHLLNEHVGLAQQEIIALSDATAMIEPDALRRAASHYQNPEVGVVCATYRLGEAGSEGERLYWRYQTQVKEDESAIASVIGTHGAFYLFRRDLWAPMPADTINDDFVLPMRIVARGYRAVYDKEIVAIEAERTTSGQEFGRRVRIGAGNMQQLLRLWRLGSPRLGWVAFLFLSGKGLRPLIPFLMLLAVVATAVLASRGWLFFQAALVGEALLFALAAYVIKRGDLQWPKPLAWPAYLVRGHTASFRGAVRILGGRSLRW